MFFLNVNKKCLGGKNKKEKKPLAEVGDLCVAGWKQHSLTILIVR
jgi:hypothetical protein